MVVVGSVNMDLHFDVAALPGPGETVLASELHHRPGGKGGNQAVAAARAGADVTMVAAVGDDAGGRALLDHLSASGVDVGAGAPRGIRVTAAIPCATVTTARVRFRHQPVKPASDCCCGE